MNRQKIIIIVIFIVVGLFGFYMLGIYLTEPKFNDKYVNPYDLKINSIGEIPNEKYCNYKSSEVKLLFNELKAISVDKDDFVYVSGDQKIQKFNSDMTLVSEFNTSKTATSIRVSKNKEIYLGMENHIEIYDSAYNLISNWEPISQKAYITSIAINNNKVYIAEAETELVYVYSKEGVQIDILGDSVPANDLVRFVLPSYYFDLEFDTEGFLWVANTGKHKLINFNSSGDLRSYWGKSSSDVEDFCGCCNPTHFSITEDGSFITSEKGLVRIKKYDSAGQFVCAIAGPEHFLKNSEGLDIAINSKQTIYVLEPMAQVIHIFNEK